MTTLARASALLLLCAGGVNLGFSQSLPEPSSLGDAGPQEVRLSGTPRETVMNGSEYDFVPEASVPVGATYSFKVEHLPIWATFDQAWGRIRGVPDSGHVGTYPDIRITLTSGETSVSLPPFTVSVLPFIAQDHGTTTLDEVRSGDGSLALSGKARTSISVGSSYQFAPWAAAAAFQPYHFEVSNLPSWATFNPLWGSVSGTPGSGDVGVYRDITISLVQGDQRATLAPFSLVVRSGATLSGGQGSARLQWGIPSTNTDGSPLLDLAGYLIYAGSTPERLEPLLYVDDPLMNEQHIYGLGPGMHYFTLRAVAIDGRQSENSWLVAKTFP